MIAEALGGLGKHRRRDGGLDRFVGIIVAARPLAWIGAPHAPSAQIPGLPGDGAELVEPIVERLDLVVAERPILDRHALRDRLGPIFLGELRPDTEIGGRDPPVQRAPMNAGAADALAGKEGAEAADRQRQFVARVAKADGVDRIVLYSIEPRPVGAL